MDPGDRENETASEIIFSVMRILSGIWTTTISLNSIGNADIPPFFRYKNST